MQVQGVQVAAMSRIFFVVHPKLLTHSIELFAARGGNGQLLLTLIIASLCF